MLGLNKPVACFVKVIFFEKANKNRYHPISTPVNVIVSVILPHYSGGETWNAPEQINTL